MKIKVLDHKDINLKKWDKCISNALNSRHYAMSWYLDIVSPEWEGAILRDYEAVMPIPFKYKYGLPTILQPFMTQQLGIFSEKKLNPDLINEFYNILKKPYPVLYSLNLYFKPSFIKSKTIKLLPNIELNIRKEYSVLRNNFSKNTKRNIANAKRFNLKLNKITNDEKYFNFYFKNLRFKFTTKEKELFKNIVNASLIRNEGSWLSVTNSEGEIISIAYFINFKNRITFLGSSSSEEGYKKLATFFLFDKIIEKYSGNNFILDFEGSQTKGVTRFYKGFGGKEKTYIKYMSISAHILTFLKGIQDKISSWA